MLKENGKLQKREKREKPSMTHRRNFGATIPHRNAICKRQVVKDHGTTCAVAT
jgi:hypothetical protein